MSGQPTIPSLPSYHPSVIPAHRVHVLPWSRSIGGRVLLANWLAITIGRDIWCWRDLDGPELAHELEHVRQWDRYGPTYIALYAWSSVAAVLAGRHWYRDNAFEVAARRAASNVQRLG
jgi:hypothetical protein